MCNNLGSSNLLCLVICVIYTVTVILWFGVLIALTMNL
jgi:hypothetical protein